MKPRTVDPDAVRVHEGLAGAKLASPVRRALAHAADWVCVVPMSMVLMIGLLWVTLSRTDPKGLEGLKALAPGSGTDAEGRRNAWVKALPLIARKEAAELPGPVREALERGETENAAALMEDRRILWSYDLSHSKHTSLNVSVDGPEKTVRLPIEKLLPSGLQPVALFAAGVIVFVLPWCFGRGATIGNRVFGIRVRRLDGHRLDLLEGFERFLGFLHIPATGGLALLSLWRDPMRRMPHDRVANTVVVRFSRRGVSRGGAPRREAVSDLPAVPSGRGTEGSGDGRGTARRGLPKPAGGPGSKRRKGNGKGA